MANDPTQAFPDEEEGSEVERQRKRALVLLASQFAMTPSSYANAAGLQSEINHVTITRVAFSEVQYRRSVNTYRRDMRFTINAISREQKRLRRSMRDYSRVLRKGRLERERRKQAEWDESKKDNSSSTDNLVLSSSDVGQTGESAPVPDVTPHSTTVPDVISDAATEELSKSTSMFMTSESNDKVEEQEDGAPKEEEKSTSRTTKKRKPVIGKKSSHGKAYFKPKRHQSKTNATTAVEPEMQEVPTEATDETDRKTEELDATAKHEDEDTVEDKTEETVNKGVSLEALRLRLGSHAQENSDSDASAASKWQLLREKHENDELVPTDSPGRKRKGKSQVTLGDLIRLQHTRGSKKLFQLVDKLAKRHGVREEVPTVPPPLPDTRDTARLVSKPDQQFFSSTAFRTAGAFYPIKYGYAVSEEMGKFVFLPSVAVVQESEEDDLGSEDQQREYPKPVYGNLVSPAGDSDFWDKVQKDLNTRRSEVSLLETPAQTERRQKRILSLPSLVKAVTKFKEGASGGGAHAVRPKSDVLPDTKADSTLPPSSRGGGLSRASGKTSSDRTPSLSRKLPPLQKRAPSVEKPEESSKVGWTTALQSMKLVHTLTDLKHHF